MNEVGCAVSTRYPTVPLPRLQGTDATHAFRKPFNSVMNACVGMPSSGAIRYSRNIDNIDSTDVVMMSCFCLEDRSVEKSISSNEC